MNLLPKTEIDFAKKEYWDKFFKERGSKKFEWYGEYSDLCEGLHKYVKKQDSILVIGCGNSMLSSDLYDVGYRQITNIDVSPVAVKQMRNKVGRERPGMIFEEMDALNMSYEEEKFSAILDKGTLDALMPDNTDDDKKRARKLFSEVDRVLKNNGRYILISLLQHHILREVLSFFTEIGWMIRITRCWDVEKKNIEETGCLTMPVFMVVCIKFKKVETSQSILEVNLFVDGKSERIATMEEVVAMIDNVHKTVLHCREIRDEMEIGFCKNGEDEVRYSIYIVDGFVDQRKLLKYAAFIVPHGREHEWLFGTKEGRRHLRDSSGFDRLAVITLHRNQDYGSLIEIQDELRQTILQLAPCNMPITTDCPRIPYLTLGDGVGRRKTIYSGASEYSGELIVEDVEIEKEIFRRLIFMNNQAVVQSEVKMKKAFSENHRSNGKYVIDSSHISSSHILYMSIPVALNKPDTSGSSASVAVIGVGGGGLCLFLHKLFPRVVITGVEIDPLVIRVAKNYFGLETDERLNIVVEDGLNFLKKTEQKFDLVMLDVDSKERGSAMCCPPPQFVEPAVLNMIAKMIGTTGVFVTNVVSRVKTEHEQLIKKLQNHFALLSWCNLREDVNRVIYASNMANLTNSQWREQIKNAASSVDKIAREKLDVSDELLDINHLLNQLMI